MRGCRLDDRASSALGLDMRSFPASHKDITVSFLFFFFLCVFHSVLLKLCMCVFLIKNKRTTTLGLLVSKFFKSEQVEIHSFFLEPINLELRLAVFNFLPIFSLICS